MLAPFDVSLADMLVVKPSRTDIARRCVAFGEDFAVNWSRGSLAGLGGVALVRLPTFMCRPYLSGDYDVAYRTERFRSSELEGVLMSLRLDMEWIVVWDPEGLVAYEAELS